MYIDPFACGVITTIMVEAIALIAYAIYLNIKAQNDDKDEDEQKTGDRT